MKQSNFSLTVLGIESHGSDRGTQQTEFRIRMRRGGSSPFTVVYTDLGNNAEYVSDWHVLERNAEYLLTFRDDFADAFHEYLDLHCYDLQPGDFLVFDVEKDVFEKIDASWFAFCPIEVSQKEAFEAAREVLSPSSVAVVSKNFDGTLKVVSKAFQGPRANSYGFDLYLCDGETRQVIDSGDFR